MSARTISILVPPVSGNPIAVVAPTRVREAVQKAGFNGLVEGVKVDFDVIDNRGKPRKICG